jgi:carbonic anhydrase
LIGLACSLFYILKSNSTARIDILQEAHPKGIVSRLILPQQVTFLNKATLVAELDSIPKYARLIIDARYTQYIDKEILDLLNEFKEGEAPSKHISLNMMGFQDHYDIHNYIDFINVTTYDVQSKLTPSQVLHILQEGNQRFLNDTRIHRSNRIEIESTSKMQHPIAVVLGCIDSRVPVETIFDMSFGDIFCARVAGNVINDDILASIEYACNVVGAKLIVILGHTQCGAILSACDGITKGHITQLLDKIKPAIMAEQDTKENRDSTNTHFVHRVSELNVANTLRTIYQRSEILRSMIDKGEVGIAGAMYNVQSGRVTYQNYIKELTQLGETRNEILVDKLKQVLDEAESLGAALT